MAHTTPIGHAHITARLVPIALLIGLLSLLSLSAVGQVICRLSQGTSYFTYGAGGLQGVIDVAEEGDTILLPGGPIPSPAGGLIVWKELVLVGAGSATAGTPVTDVTTILNNNGSFSLTTNAGGSSFHGINFEDNIGIGSNFSGAHFTRCKFSSSVPVPTGPGSGMAASDLHFKHCVFTAGLVQPNGTSPQNVTLDNCIIDGSIALGEQTATAWITNCILLDPDLTQSQQNLGVTYDRCIFVRNAGNWTAGDRARYNDCVFASSPGAGLDFTNGAVDDGGNESHPLFSPALFVNLTNWQDYWENSDFHLAGVNGTTMGTSGFDAGIHDGVSGNAWKPDAVPFNPHWISLPTGFGTTNGGLLNSVNIGGAAQQD